VDAAAKNRLPGGRWLGDVSLPSHSRAAPIASDLGARTQPNWLFSVVASRRHGMRGNSSPFLRRRSDATSTPFPGHRIPPLNRARWRVMGLQPVYRGSPVGELLFPEILYNHHFVGPTTVTLSDRLY
jgi:hypothetical protein